MKPTPDNPEKILILHSGGIGDLLLALPAMRVFRRAFPLSSLEIMGLPERLGLVARDLQVEKTHSIDRAGMAYFYLDDAPLPGGLCSFFSSFGWILSFGKAGGETLSRNLRKAGAGRVLSLPSFPAEGGKTHVSAFLLDSLKKEGIAGQAPDLPLQLPEGVLTSAGEFWALSGVEENQPVLAIHPGSGSAEKNWPPENFAAVADWAGERAGILLIAGPAEDGAKKVKRAMKKANPLSADNLPLIRLAGILKRCRAYLGNDSGITHLAASLGLPTIALFGPTDPEVWGPRGVGVRILREKPPRPQGCSHAQSHGCRPSRINIDPEEVIEALAPLFVL